MNIRFGSSRPNPTQSPPLSSVKGAPLLPLESSTSFEIQDYRVAKENLRHLVQEERKRGMLNEFEGLSHILTRLENQKSNSQTSLTRTLAKFLQANQHVKYSIQANNHEATRTIHDLKRELCNATRKKNHDGLNQTECEYIGVAFKSGYQQGNFIFSIPEKAGAVINWPLLDMFMLTESVGCAKAGKIRLTADNFDKFNAVFGTKLQSGTPLNETVNPSRTQPNEIDLLVGGLLKELDNLFPTTS